MRLSFVFCLFLYGVAASFLCGADEWVLLHSSKGCCYWAVGFNLIRTLVNSDEWEGILMFIGGGGNRKLIPWINFVVFFVSLSFKTCPRFVVIDCSFP